MKCFLGTLLLKVGTDGQSALNYLERAVSLLGYSNPLMIANYLEALRVNKAYDRAKELIASLIPLAQYQPSSATALFYYNCAMLELSYPNNKLNAIDYLYKALQADPNNHRAWKSLIELLIEKKDFVKAEELANQAIRIATRDHRLIYLRGVAIHHLSRLDEAVEDYKTALSLEPTYYPALANLGAAYQALGKVELAAQCFDVVIQYMPHDAGNLLSSFACFGIEKDLTWMPFQGIRNNYGALLISMDKSEKGIQLLKDALTIDPLLTHALVNLAGRVPFP